MGYTIEDIVELSQTTEGVATLIDCVSTSDGGEIETPIILQVISGHYSNSEKENILLAVQSMINSYKRKITEEQYKGSSEGDFIYQIYLQYIQKGELMYNLIQLCLDKHKSTNPKDIALCNTLYAILATSIPGA